MALTEYSGDTDYVASLDNLPNDVGGLTPAQLKAVFDQFGTEFVAWFNETHVGELDVAIATIPGAASETVAGKVELATAEETTTGEDDTRAVHPAGLKVELDKKLNLAGGTLTGVVTAKSGTDYTTKQVRNIRFKATDDFTTDDLANGEIGFVYTP
jgi:hypothetical protein